MKSTPHQRQFLRVIFEQNELPLDRVTVMHRPLFEAANLPWSDGEDLEATFCAMEREEIARLMVAAKRRYGGIR